jgi:mannose-6-phosphate isomerase-like protein (cupin superfamily)
MKKSLLPTRVILLFFLPLLLVSFFIGLKAHPFIGGSGKAAADRHDHEDMGKKPWVLDIEEATVENSNYRIAKWSGEYMQMVLMSLKPGEIIDLEIHEDHDQFIRIEQGEARVLMGRSEDKLDYDEKVSDDWAIFIPAGYWHKVENTGKSDLKLYTIYAPGEHPEGTIHKTYKEATEHGH